MYKSLLIIIGLTMSLTSCYTQFSLSTPSSSYTADIPYGSNGDDTAAASDYYDGYYDLQGGNADYNVNNYYGSSWYGASYYPHYGYYSGWYSPYGYPGGYAGGYICYPSYPFYYENEGGNYSPADKGSRSFGKGKSSRTSHGKRRSARSFGGGSAAPVEPSSPADITSGNNAPRGAGRGRTKRDANTSGVSRGGAVAAAAIPSHISDSGKKTITSKPRRNKKRRIRYIPSSTVSRSNAKNSYAVKTAAAHRRGTGYHKTHKSAGSRSASGGFGSRSSSVSSSHRASAAVSSSSSNTHKSRSSSGKSAASRRHR